MRLEGRGQEEENDWVNLNEGFVRSRLGSIHLCLRKANTLAEHQRFATRVTLFGQTFAD